MKSIKSIGFTFFLASQFVPSLAKEDDYKELWWVSLHAERVYSIYHSTRSRYTYLWHYESLCFFVKSLFDATRRYYIHTVPSKLVVLSQKTREIHYTYTTYHRDACAYCDHGIVKKYAAEDPNIATTNTVSGETCLMLTAVSNCISVAELMIELGADVNAVVDHPSVSILRLSKPLLWSHHYVYYAMQSNLIQLLFVICLLTLWFYTLRRVTGILR
jgi:hypothetical protein